MRPDDDSIVLTSLDLDIIQDQHVGSRKESFIAKPGVIRDCRQCPVVRALVVRSKHFLRIIYLMITSDLLRRIF